MKSKNKYLILSGYGLVTFCALFINLIIIENIFPKTFNEKIWTIGKEFGWLMWIIFSIGLGNAFYTKFLIDDYFQFDIYFFISFQLSTIIIGTIPSSILIITKQKYLLRKNLNSASELNKSLVVEKNKITRNKVIRFYADNEKDFIEFNLNDFLYIESSGNYVELYILDSDKITRKTFRSTLKRSLDFFTDSPKIIQCHRAFIVNTNKILKTTGNSQGLRLSLQSFEIEVPVSRGFVNDVKNKIN
jgi:transposase